MPQSHTHTGEDDVVETKEDFAKRMNKESLYDDMLSLWDQIEENKEVAAGKREQQKAYKKQLLVAGKATLNAATNRYKRHRQDVVTEEDDGDNDPTGSRKRRRLRRSRNANRKAKQMRGMIQPLADVMNKQIRESKRQARRDRRFQQESTNLNAKMDAIMLSILGKDRLTVEQRSGVADLASGNHFTKESSSSESSSDSDIES